MGSTGTREVFIPVEGSDEVVAVPVDQLPEDPEELLEILRAEAAPLVLWIDIAKAYLACSKDRQFLHVLSEGTSNEVEEFFGDKARFERLQIFCGLGAFFVAKGRRTANRTERTQHFSAANKHFQEAKSIDPNDQLPYLGMGQLALAKGDLKAAKANFQQGLMLTCNGRKNISCLLMLAAMLFNQGRHAEALSLYCRALREHPSCPAEVRLGLAACYFRLGQTDRAATAYRRVLALSPENVDAKVGLALLEFNSGTKAGQDAGLALLGQAYRTQPGHPLVLNLLAHYCLIKKDYEKVKALAQAALERCDVDAIRAQSACLLARAHHALGRYTEALKHYQQASKLDRAALLPRFGLSQMMLLQREHTNAVTLLEQILADRPGWVDALKILGPLYPQLPGKGSKAVADFREAATKEQPGVGANALIWELLGDLLAPTDPSGALSAYRKAIALHRQSAQAAAAKQPNGGAAGGGQQQEPPAAAVAPEEEKPAAISAKLLNNAAVLTMRSGDAQGAIQLMQEALQAGDVGDSVASTLTMGYNLARLKEAAGQLRTAQAEYRAILEQFPGYVDCHLRLASIARACGDSKAAVESAQRAVAAREGHQDSLAMLAFLLLEAKQFEAAKEALDSLARADKGDKAASAAAGGGAAPPVRYEAYAKLAQANLQLYTVPADLRKEDARRKAETHLWHAMELYRRVLEKEPGNVYAANGLGAVLAEAGHLDAAKDVFLQVQEAAAGTDGFVQLPEAWVNLGHTYLAQQNHVSAVRMYTSALRRFYGGQHPRVLLYLARAHYDARNLAEAQRVLRAALHLDPADHKLHFNVALCMQQYAIDVLKRKSDDKQVVLLEEVESAVGQLGTALRKFKHLRSLGTPVTGVDAARLDSHIDFVEDSQKRAQVVLEKSRGDQRLLDTRRKQQAAKLEAERLQRQLQQEQKRALEEAEELERQRLAKAHAERLAALKQSWKDQEAMVVSVEDGEGGAKGKRKRKKGKAGEEEGFIDDEEPMRMPRPQAAAAGAADMDVDGGAEGEEEGEDEAQRRLRAAGLDSGSEGEEEEGRGAEGMRGNGGPAREAPAGGGGRLKKRRLSGAGGGAAGEGEEEAGGAAEGLEDLEDEEPDANGDEAVAAAADDEEQQQQRQRKVAALFDSDDEDEGGGTAAEGVDQEPASQAVEAAEPAADAGQAAVDALFGSSDEDE